MTARADRQTGARPPWRAPGPIPRPSSVLLHSRVLLIAVLVVGSGLGLTAAVAHESLLAVDEPISEALRSDTYIEIFRQITRLGASAPAVAFALFAGVLLWPRCRSFAVLLPAAVIMSLVVDVGLKVVVDRPRPPDPETGTALGAFPSGHALRAVVLFGLLPPALYVVNRSRRLFWASVPVAVVAVLLTAYSRVYLGAHWPTDVLASMLIGAFLLLGVEYLLASGTVRWWCEGCPIHAPLDVPPHVTAAERRLLQQRGGEAR